MADQAEMLYGIRIPLIGNKNLKFDFVEYELINPEIVVHGPREDLVQFVHHLAGVLSTAGATLEREIV